MMLCYRSAVIPNNWVLSAIKLFTSVALNEGPAHPVKQLCAYIFYANDEGEHPFASKQMETHEAISESEIRRIFKRNEDNMNGISEKGINTTSVKRHTLRFIIEDNEVSPKSSIQKSLSISTKVK